MGNLSRLRDRRRPTSAPFFRITSQETASEAKRTAAPTPTPRADEAQEREAGQ